MNETGCLECEQSIYTKGIRKDFDEFKSKDFTELKDRVNDLEHDVSELNKKSAARDVQYDNTEKQLKNISIQNWAIIVLIITSLLGYFFSKQ